MLHQDDKSRLSIAALTFLFLQLFCNSAFAKQELPVADGQSVAERASTTQDLYLEVTINGSPMNLIGNFKQLPSGELAATADELQQIGIKPVASAIGADGLVIIDRLPSVKYQIDVQAQRIEFNATDDERSEAMLDASNAAKGDRVRATSTTGAVLDYTLFAASNSLEDRHTDLVQGVSGSFDARVFSKLGVLRSSFITGYTDGEFDTFRRLNTSWSYSDPERMLTYRVGDIISGGLPWTRSVYLGGVQVERNFALRPDLITQPLPSFGGSAAVPSTVEVFTQNAMTYTGNVQSGPFHLVNIPAATGQGQARVVIRDSMGRETVSTVPYYSSAMLLKKGLLSFSAEVGAPRRDYGIESNNYDKRIYGSFSARYGVSDWLTLESHVEGGEDLLNGGIGMAFPLFGYGAASIAVAGSQSEGDTGGLINASIELGYNRWTLYGRIQQSFGDYQDIASVTADSRVDWKTFGFIGARVPKSIKQVSVGIPMPGNLSNLNLAYTQFEQRDGISSKIGSASYTQPLFKKSSVYVTAFKDFEKRNSYGLFAGLTIPFDNGINATTGVETDNDGSRVFAELSKAEELRDGSFGWRVRTAEGKNPQRSATGSYRSSIGRAEASVEQVDDQSRATAQFEGSIVAAGGDVFMTNRIDDAFAIVNVGAPNVDVSYQNRPAGKTNSRGRVIVTDLRSYEENTITVDPRNLPIDADIPTTKEVVVPRDRSGVVVDFGVSETSAAALVSFVDAAGNAIPVSATGSMAGSGESFVIGYDGQTYIHSLAGKNEATIDLGNGNSCQATFPYRPSKGTQVVIQKVVCQ